MAEEMIRALLERKRREGFDGCVKLVFEDGRLSQVSEANHIDLPMTRVFSKSAVSELSALAGEKGFCGSLAFSFNHGEIELYSYMRNYRGSSLEAFLGGGEADEGKGRRRK